MSDRGAAERRPDDPAAAEAAAPPSAPDASARILRATARLLATEGAAQINMQEVARAARVSKGLIHYHFTDKDTLLARAAVWIADGLIERERQALSSASPRTAIDALWGWLESELSRGELRALQELARYPAPAVSDAAREIASRRRQAATVTVEALFTTLGLRPRLPAAMLGEAVLAFTDGLAVRPDGERGGARAAFDVLWLALLGLTE